MISIIALAVMTASSALPPKKPGEEQGGYIPIVQTIPLPEPSPLMLFAGDGTPPAWSITVMAGSEGDFPGSVYSVDYRLDVLMETANHKWVPVPAASYTRSQTLDNDIEVKWNYPKVGTDVKHGVNGSITIQDPNLTRVKLELHWVPQGDQPRPDKTKDEVVVAERIRR